MTSLIQNVAQGPLRNVAQLRGALDVSQAVEYCRAVMAALPDSTVLIVSPDATVLAAEGGFLERRGLDPRSLSGIHLTEVFPNATSEELMERFAATLAQGSQSYDYRTVDGAALCWVHQTAIYLGGEEPAAVIIVGQDITRKDHLHGELRRERERRIVTEQMTGCGHWEIDLCGDTVRLSEGARRLLDRTDAPVSVTAFAGSFGDEACEQVLAMLRHAVETGVGEYEGDVPCGGGSSRRVLMRASPTQDADGRDVIAGTVFDITALRAAEAGSRESEALLSQGFDGSPIGMGLTDPRTGRMLRANDALCRLLGRSREEILGLTVADFSHPEDAGTIATFLADVVSGTAAAADFEKRYLKPDGTVVWVALHVVPVYGAGHELRAFFAQIVDLTARKQREQQLMQDAADFECLAEIRAALAENRLELHAQPIMDLRSGQLIQQELLIRLRTTDGQLMPPSEFLPVAERRGAIGDIDRWVTQQAVELAAAGHAVEINLSALSVGDEQLLSTIHQSLARSGADPSLLVFEVTETALMADVNKGRRFAADLRALGCRLALDDFGTGYGTLTYLKHIPIDYIKIDIEFVRDLLDSPQDQRLVQSIVMMARTLGKKTTAEGVEDEGTLRRLRELGVDFAQGYHIGRPASLAASLVAQRAA